MASLNKQALIRYRIIGKLIESGTYPSMQDFIYEIEDKIGKVSSETIQKDIRALKKDLALGYLAPIKYNRTYKGYELTDSDYSFDKVSLNDNEFGILEDTIDILKQFTGTSFSENYNSAINQISSSIKEVKDNRQGTIISLEPQSEYIGLSDIDNFINYIKEYIPISVIDVKNNDFKGDIIHCYMLKEYQKRWYVIAYSEIFEEIKVYDIRYLYDVYQLTKRKFIFKEFNDYNFFKDSIGVGIIKGLKEKIRIEFSNLVYDEINSIPLHKSQKIIKHKKNGNIIIEIEVYVTNEFFNLIFSYATSAKVLSPNWVVGMMKCFILNMYKTYRVEKNDCSKKYLIGNK